MKKFLTAAMTAAILTQACAWLDEVGKDKSSAELRLTSAPTEDTELACPANSFPMRFSFFDLDNNAEMPAAIQMYETYPDIMTSQYAMITFAQRDARNLQPCKAPGDILGSEQPLTRDGCLRMAVQFNNCDTPFTARILGSLTLDEFSTERGKRIKGKLAGKLVYFEQIKSATDTLEREAEIGTVEGEFSFVNHAGAVWNK